MKFKELLNIINLEKDAITLENDYLVIKSKFGTDKYKVDEKMLKKININISNLEKKYLVANEFKENSKKAIKDLMKTSIKSLGKLLAIIATMGLPFLLTIIWGYPLSVSLLVFAITALPFGVPAIVMVADDITEELAYDIKYMNYVKSNKINKRKILAKIGKLKNLKNKLVEYLNDKSDIQKLEEVSVMSSVNGYQNQNNNIEVPMPKYEVDNMNVKGPVRTRKK